MSEIQMQIGEVAERTGLSINTIRHYDQTGLVAPSARSPGGFRLYTETDVDRLLIIRRMKPLGFSLEQMGELLAVTDQLASATPLANDAEEQLHAALCDFQIAARTKRDRLAAELAYAEEFIANIESIGRRAESHS